MAFEIRVSVRVLANFTDFVNFVTFVTLLNLRLLPTCICCGPVQGRDSCILEGLINTRWWTSVGRASCHDPPSSSESLWRIRYFFPWNVVVSR